MFLNGFRVLFASACEAIAEPSLQRGQTIAGGGVAEPGPDALAGEPGWNESFRIAVRGRTSSHCVGWQKETRNVEESVSDEKHTIGVMSEAEIDAL